MSKYTASNYRQHTAARLAKIKPRWVTNAETGVEFLLRPVGSAMSIVLAGNMPSGLTAAAIKAWKERGETGIEDVETIAASLTPEQIQDGMREQSRLSALIQEACVIPFLSNQTPSEIEFTAKWKADAIEGLTEKDKSFDPETFDPKEYVLNPLELDGADSGFLFKWAQGLVGLTGLRGGGATDIRNVSNFPKKLNRRSGSRTDGARVRKSA
jgi:hypothetical protein